MENERGQFRTVDKWVPSTPNLIVGEMSLH